MPRIESIQKMLESEPQDVFLNFALAMEYLKADRKEDALAQFESVNRLDPDYVPAYLQRGQTLIALNRKDDGRSVLREGIDVAQRTGDKHAAQEMRDMVDLLG